MMKLEYTFPHNLEKLTSELLQIPDLQPQEIDGELVSVFTIKSDGEKVSLNVPNDADVQAIEAVINTHDPTPLPIVPIPTKDERLEALEQAVIILMMED